MRATFIVTDNDGNTWEFDLPIRPSAPSAASRGRARSSKKDRPVTASASQKPDLKLPLRAFVKKYAKGLSGSRKFTLLIAHLSAGDTTTEVQLGEIEKQWNRMTGLLGDFNAAYSTRAKDEGWVDSPKYGAYKLLSTWEEAVPNG